MELLSESILEMNKKVIYFEIKKQTQLFYKSYSSQMFCWLPQVCKYKYWKLTNLDGFFSFLYIWNI